MSTWKQKLNKAHRRLSALIVLKSLTLFFSLAAQPVAASDAALPANVWRGEEVRPPDGLPDGSVSLFGSDNDKTLAAWYGSPTGRYRHGILGDAIEAGSLHVEVRDGRRYSLVLPDTQVFEDRTPHLVDLDGDGQAEILTIRSGQRTGASVVLYGLRNDRLVELASTEPIGRPNRWLNIAGVQDYAGSGSLQIAYVETPHIGGTLYFVEWRDNRLVPVASLFGFSNHEIGARDQKLSGDLNFDGDQLMDLAVPSDDRRMLKIIGFRNGELAELDRFPLPSPVKHLARADTGEPKGCLTFRLENRTTARVCPLD